VDIVPLLIIGLLAGVISGVVTGTRGAEGYLASFAVGIVGAFLGAWLSGLAGIGQPGDVISGLVLATVGASLVRVALQAMARRG
jgi:uncharacterized membrane protein YeaQ/YmgE (transglycosylase-associated protein family)